MRKYRIQKWPFLAVLFTGLTCAPALPEGFVVNEPNMGLYVEKHDGKQSDKKGSDNRKRTKHHQETYLFGPQLIVLMP